MWKSGELFEHPFVCLGTEAESADRGALLSALAIGCLSFASPKTNPTLELLESQGSSPTQIGLELPLC